MILLSKLLTIFLWEAGNGNESKQCLWQMLLPNLLEVEVKHPHQAFVRQTVRCLRGGCWGRGWKEGRWWGEWALGRGRNKLLSQIIVHLLVDYQVIRRLTGMKGTLRNCRYIDICSILRGSPGSYPRCWYELTDGDSGWFHLPTSFQKVITQSILNHSVGIGRFCALQSLWYSGPSPCFQWNLNCDFLFTAACSVPVTSPKFTER